jgi:hypothetical protein
LRAAISSANSQGGGAITFSGVTGTITLRSPLPSLAANTTITGPGSNVITISGNGQFRVMSVNARTTNTLSGLTIANGAVSDSFGAGIWNAGSLSLLNCVVRNCTNLTTNAKYRGGGIYNAGSLFMNQCSISNCSVYFAGQSGPGGGIANAGSLSMKACTVSGCSAYFGGGIYNEATLQLTNCIIENCEAVPEADGGGIYNSGSGSASLSACVVSNCYAFWGGGLESFGTLAVTNSSIVENLAEQLGGGALVSSNCVFYGCTISGNSTANAGGGVSVYPSDGGQSFYNCTISLNSSPESSGGAGLDASGTTLLCHCTVVSNTGPQGITAGTNFNCNNCILADCSGTLISGGYNLIENLAGCVVTGDPTGNIYGVDPLLGPLQDNGGPTWTMALLRGSPAIDQGSAAGLATDQRGVRRPFDVPGIPNAADGSDIGAYEYTLPQPFISGTVGQSGTNFCLNVQGTSGYVYFVQASCDLVNWVTIGSAAADQNGRCQFVDSQMAAFPCRFYRAGFSQ